MPIAVEMIRESIGPVIPSLVSIDIEQAIPAQIEIMTVMTASVPAMKIAIAMQPVWIMMTVPDNVVPVVCPVVTTVC